MSALNDMAAAYQAIIITILKMLVDKKHIICIQNKTEEKKTEKKKIRQDKYKSYTNRRMSFEKLSRCLNDINYKVRPVKLNSALN